VCIDRGVAKGGVIGSQPPHEFLKTPKKIAEIFFEVKKL